MSGGQLGSRRPTRQRNTLLPQEPLRWMGRRALWLDRRLPRPSQWSLSDGMNAPLAGCLASYYTDAQADWVLVEEARQTPEPSFWARWCSRLNYATLIRRALACSALGSTSVTTPSFISALILPWSILLEIWKLRT